MTSRGGDVEPFVRLDQVDLDLATARVNDPALKAIRCVRWFATQPLSTQLRHTCPHSLVRPLSPQRRAIGTDDFFVRTGAIIGRKFESSFKRRDESKMNAFPARAHKPASDAHFYTSS